MDYMLLWFGVTGLFSEYGKGLGIFLTAVCAPLLIFLVIKIRNAKDQEDRILMTIGKEGIWTPSEGMVTWETFADVTIRNNTRQMEYLELQVKDPSKKKGFRKMMPSTQFSRYNPRYLKTVIEWYYREWSERKED